MAKRTRVPLVLWIAGGGAAAWLVYTFANKQTATAQAQTAASTPATQTPMPGTAANTTLASTGMVATAAQNAAIAPVARSGALTLTAADSVSRVSSSPTFGLLR